MLAHQAAPTPQAQHSHTPYAVSMGRQLVFILLPCKQMRQSVRQAPTVCQNRLSITDCADPSQSRQIHMPPSLPTSRVVPVYTKINIPYTVIDVASRMRASRTTFQTSNTSPLPLPTSAIKPTLPKHQTGAGNKSPLRLLHTDTYLLPQRHLRYSDTRMASKTSRDLRAYAPRRVPRRWSGRLHGPSRSTSSRIVMMPSARTRSLHRESVLFWFHCTDTWSDVVDDKVCFVLRFDKIDLYHVSLWICSNVAGPSQLCNDPVDI